MKWWPWKKQQASPEVGTYAAIVDCIEGHGDGLAIEEFSLYTMENAAGEQRIRISLRFENGYTLCTGDLEADLAVRLGAALTNAAIGARNHNDLAKKEA